VRSDEFLRFIKASFRKNNWVLPLLTKPLLHLDIQVETAACYCGGVDAGLSVGGRRFVPGRTVGLCVRPDIKPTITLPKKPARGERRIPSELLPGLPDDLAIACLIRVPRFYHRKLRVVCKRWDRLLAGNFFYSLRRRLGMAEEWVYVIKRDRDGRISWHAFDPRYSSTRFFSLCISLLLFISSLEFSYMTNFDANVIYYSATP
jgi:hypothetical protein